MFARNLESWGDRTAVVTKDGRHVTYAELARLADAPWGDLTDPTEPGTLVAIECRNDLSSLAAYLGALRRNCPVLLLDAQLDLSAREAMYAHYGIARVYSDERLTVRSASGPTVHPSVALLLSTSGSTGSPKLVKLSLDNLQSNAESIVQYLGLDQSERPAIVLPMHYSYGLSVINSHLQVGATLLLTDEPVTSKSFWSLFKEQQATSLSGVPTTYAILKQLRFERMDLPSLRTVTQAGGRLPLDLVRWYGELAAARGWRFFVMYGQTEATARIAYLPPEKVLELPDAIGKPVPGGRIELRDDQDQPVTQAGQTGEIVYHGPNVMLGYATSRDELQQGDVQLGALRTGDLAWQDAQGYYHISGRRSRFIKVSGNRMGLDDIEQQLRAQGYDAAVTGEDETLMIALLKDADEAELVQHLFDRYRLRKASVRLLRIDALPLTSAGKIRYDALRELFSF